MPRRFPAPILTASLAAGPIFVVSTGLAALYLQLPKAVEMGVEPGDILPLILLPIPVILFGFLLSFIPNTIGTGFMLLVGFEFPAARSSAAWIVTGALFGTAIAWATGGLSEPAMAFGLTSTSASCAAICRIGASWD